MHAHSHALSHHIHYQPLSMHAPLELAVILELSCVFPVNLITPVLLEPMLCLNGWLLMPM
jgi:hypothetical protein